MRQTSQGIIAEHFSGIGTVTRDMVVERAREIAVINGRPGQRYTRDDFIEAKRELTGRGVVEVEDERYLEGITRWDEEPGTTGHPVERVEPTDEQTFAELLVEEGASEAEHERMVAGARQQESE